MAQPDRVDSEIETNKNMADKPLIEIANRITDSILADNIFEREKLNEKIRSLLSVWMDWQKRPMDWDNPKHGEPKTDIGKLKYQNQKKSYENIFWRRKLREIIGEEKMKPLYEEITNELEKF